MNVVEHYQNNLHIAEVESSQILIHSIEGGMQLLSDLYDNHYDSIILYEKNIASSFFDANTGMARELLNKSVNFRVPIAIIGDFTKYNCPRIQQFIRESNEKRQISFVTSLSEALFQLS